MQNSDTEFRSAVLDAGTPKEALAALDALNNESGSVDWEAMVHRSLSDALYGVAEWGDGEFTPLAAVLQQYVDDGDPIPAQSLLSRHGGLLARRPPWDQFANWFQVAVDHGIKAPSLMRFCMESPQDKTVALSVVEQGGLHIYAFLSGPGEGMALVGTHVAGFALHEVLGLEEGDGANPYKIIKRLRQYGSGQGGYVLMEMSQFGELCLPDGTVWCWIVRDAKAGDGGFCLREDFARGLLLACAPNPTMRRRWARRIELGELVQIQAWLKSVFGMIKGYGTIIPLANWRYGDDVAMVVNEESISGQLRATKATVVKVTPQWGHEWEHWVPMGRGQAALRILRNLKRYKPLMEAFDAFVNKEVMDAMDRPIRLPKSGHADHASAKRATFLSQAMRMYGDSPFASPSHARVAFGGVRQSIEAKMRDEKSPGIFMPGGRAVWAYHEDAGIPEPARGEVHISFTEKGLVRCAVTNAADVTSELVEFLLEGSDMDDHMIFICCRWPDGSKKMFMYRHPTGPGRGWWLKPDAATEAALDARGQFWLPLDREPVELGWAQHGRAVEPAPLDAGKLVFGWDALTQMDMAITAAPWAKAVGMVANIGMAIDHANRWDPAVHNHVISDVVDAVNNMNADPMPMVAYMEERFGVLLDSDVLWDRFHLQLCARSVRSYFAKKWDVLLKEVPTLNELIEMGVLRVQDAWAKIRRWQDALLERMEVRERVVSCLANGHADGYCYLVNDRIAGFALDAAVFHRNVWAQHYRLLDKLAIVEVEASAVQRWQIAQLREALRADVERLDCANLLLAYKKASTLLDFEPGEFYAACLQAMAVWHSRFGLSAAQGRTVNGVRIGAVPKPISWAALAQLPQAEWQAYFNLFAPTKKEKKAMRAAGMPWRGAATLICHVDGKWHRDDVAEVRVEEGVVKAHRENGERVDVLGSEAAVAHGCTVAFVGYVNGGPYWRTAEGHRWATSRELGVFEMIDLPNTVEVGPPAVK